ncbi:hypothetical protein [uncultured Methylobacterium sp.]|uniref:hypothetical protein n=1 Tax=uncultured Methylobacterium sp. TaxID=157278 RepID=UPI0035CABAD7
MTQAHPTSGAEPDAACPVSLELLGAVYRADAYDFPEIVERIPPLKRAQLAAYLYGKSHMHQLGLQVARACAREDLIRAAGEVGSVIHGQAHLPAKPAAPAPAALAPGAKKVSLGGGPKKISLGGSAAKGRSFD